MLAEAVVTSGSYLLQAPQRLWNGQADAHFLSLSFVTLFYMMEQKFDQHLHGSPLGNHGACCSHNCGSTVRMPQ